MKSKGFTLIELLLVTGIVSILMSVIFFRVTEAKKKAEDAQMISQSAQVARAVYQYKEDHNGFVPRPVSSTGPNYAEQYLESEPSYTDALQPLVTGGYLPSIPYSPSGTGYTYIVSEDGTEGVFAADLNFVRSNSSSKNSCQFIVDNSSSSNNSCVPFTESPPVAANFSIIKINLPSYGGMTGSCSSGFLESQYGSYPYSCVDNNASTQSMCSCVNGITSSNNPSSVPDEVCSHIFWPDCTVRQSSAGYSYYKAFAWNIDDFNAYQNYLIDLEDYIIERDAAELAYSICMAQVSGDPICGGSVETDNCECL